MIPLTSFFYLLFDQMDGTWAIWSLYPIDPFIRDPIKRSPLYKAINVFVAIPFQYLSINNWFHTSATEAKKCFSHLVNIFILQYFNWMKCNGETCILIELDVDVRCETCSAKSNHDSSLPSMPSQTSTSFLCSLEMWSQSLLGIIKYISDIKMV